MTSISDIEIFVNVVKHASFTRAAHQLGISKAHVSQQINHLEKRLNTKLINRTTRQMLLTEAGEHYYEKVAEILDLLEEAEESVSDQQCAPKGNLNISMPSGKIGENYLAPSIMKFMALYPNINIKLDLSTDRVDLLAGKYDLAIRAGDLPDSSLIAKKLCEFQYHIYASPAYIKMRGKPQTPKDLINHNCLLVHESMNKWPFKYERKTSHIKVGGSLICNNGHGLVAAVMNGVGVVRLPNFQVESLVKDKKVVKLLMSYQMPAANLWLVYQQNRHVPNRLRLLIDYLHSEFSEKSPWAD